MTHAQPNSTTAAPDELLTTGEVADLFDVDPKTVLRWANTGNIPSFKTPGNHRRYRLADIQARIKDGQQ